jgi:Carboxypeptidase regulatory-like domain/TonB dependent receptor
MFRKPFLIFAVLIAIAAALLTVPLSAQTTNGLMTGVVSDPTGAVVNGVTISVTNQATNEHRTTTTDQNGYYIVPQLPPGIYDISIEKSGFATENRSNVQLQVNQNATLDFALTVASTSRTIQVTGAPPPLNTTSATLGTVVTRATIVDMPLNGRDFTELALLTPGAAPIQASQQSSDMISLGAGGISPTVNGQRPRNNNFTLDGVLNNETFVNAWAISPPPDALQEFNVQSHITDAQFSVSSGANINIATRTGTNSFHGALWEFLRNNALDAHQYPATTNLPFHMNQYGVYFGGPVLLPHFHGKDNTWFSAYWEGFRSSTSTLQQASTLTTAMAKGDFSALEGTTPIGMDDLGRPEYQNEIYDPSTGRVDPKNSSLIIRDPFSGNVIPAGRINPDAPLILEKYYPAPNLNVAANVLPNYAFPGVTTIASDSVGIRVDHSFANSDTLFGRYNRSNINEITPTGLPSAVLDDVNYARQVALGYTHAFGANTLLNVRYGYTNVDVFNIDTPAGQDFVTALNLALWAPPQIGYWLSPAISMSNGYTGVSQTATITGPQSSGDYHADLTKIIGNNTLGIGGMFYHINSNSGGFGTSITFPQNSTSLAGAATSTGMGPASLLLGLPGSYQVTAGNVHAALTVNWYGGYVQDLWKATKRLAITAGLRYDFVSPPNYSKAISAMDITNGQFLITQPSTPFSPLYPEAVGSSHLFYPQYNGFQPRLGISYQASPRTVFSAAFAVLDDHNNTTVQLYANPRVSWPSSVQTTVSTLNQSLPTASSPLVYINNLPPETTFLNPTSTYVSYGFDPHTRIAYSNQYNAGIEHQFLNSFVLDIDYVGSESHNELIQATGNTARIPGPGSLSSRGQPYPQYGGPFNFDSNTGPASYNALQAKLQKSLSSGLYFLASYTWSKSLDITSDAYGSAPENVYNLHADWGPSDFDLGQIFVLSGVYALPVGKGNRLLSTSNRSVQLIAGDWNVGGILSMHSGSHFDVTASGDVANVGGGTQRANRIGNPYAAPGFRRSRNEWINIAAFANPASYTFGNEGRNSLDGPAYKDTDINLYKDIPVTEKARLQFRSEFFNVFNHTNLNNPSSGVVSSSFGKISGASSPREIQFALKALF